MTHDELPVRYKDIPIYEKRKIRDKYVQLQKGNCFYCQESLDKDAPKRITKKKIKFSLFPPNFFLSPIHLQHNHKTGMTEGAVHSYCNAVMWQYEGR